MSHDFEPTGGDGRELDTDAFETLKAKIETVVERAKLVGVNPRVVIQAGDQIMGRYEYGANEQLFGASLGKLPLAAMIVETGVLEDDALWPIPRDAIDEAGGGIFDDANAPSEATTAELLRDMLQLSGNTAVRILAPAVGGATLMNYFYQHENWFDTKVQPSEDGRVFLGNTTANEALAQLQHIITRKTGSAMLRSVAVKALTENAVARYGIRSRVQPTDAVTIINKTGEYNGDNEDSSVYRHDVERVQGSEGTIWYAFMTTSNRMGRGILANHIVGQLGAEVAQAAGAHDFRSIGQQLLSRFKE